MATKAIHRAAAVSLAVLLCPMAGCSRPERTGALKAGKDRGAGQTIEAGAGTVEPGYGPVAREVLDDAGVTARVKAKLLADPQLNAMKIDVDTTRGQVTLNGKVASAGQRSAAEVLASQTEGVKSIVNLIQVAVQEPPGPSPGETPGRARPADPRLRGGTRESPRGRR